MLLNTVEWFHEDAPLFQCRMTGTSYDSFGHNRAAPIEHQAPALPRVAKDKLLEKIHRQIKTTN